MIRRGEPESFGTEEQEADAWRVTPTDTTTPLGDLRANAEGYVRRLGQALRKP